MIRNNIYFLAFPVCRLAGILDMSGSDGLPKKWFRDHLMVNSGLLHSWQSLKKAIAAKVLSTVRWSELEDYRITFTTGKYRSARDLRRMAKCLCDMKSNHDLLLQAQNQMQIARPEPLPDRHVYGNTKRRSLVDTTISAADSSGGRDVDKDPERDGDGDVTIQSSSPEDSSACTQPRLDASTSNVRIGRNGNGNEGANPSPITEYPGRLTQFFSGRNSRATYAVPSSPRIHPTAAAEVV
jgi:hypothetical protein